MGRTPSCSKEGLNRGAWTTLEDKILTDYIRGRGEGIKWASIPKETGLKRGGKSCRLRWLNYLRPDIKRGNISLEEEDLIIRLHKLLGNRWSLIAGRIPGRTDNEIKNYWNSTIKKKIQAKQEKPPMMELSSVLPPSPVLNEEHLNTQTMVEPSFAGGSAKNVQAEWEFGDERLAISGGNENLWDFLTDLDAEPICPSEFLDSSFMKLWELNTLINVGDCNYGCTNDSAPSSSQNHP